MEADKTVHFEQLLKQNDVNSDIIERLRATGCTTIKLFSNWVESKSELKADVVDQAKTTGHK